MLLAGSAQVHVRVDEAREQVPAGARDRLDTGGVQRARRRDFGDRPAADQDVVGRVDVRARVKHVDLAHQEVGGQLWADDEAHASWGSGARSGTRAPESSS